MPSPAPRTAAARSLIIVGCGGHAVVLMEALRASGAQILTALDNDSEKVGKSIAGVRITGGDHAVFDHNPAHVALVNGVGSIANPTVRKVLYERFKAAGYDFATVIHPSAVVASDAELGEGVQIMAGAVVQPRCSIGANSIVNTRVGIDHDCRIGGHVHIAPGATVCGDVAVGDTCHIGAGATLIQGVRLAAGCIVGAGAVVIASFEQPATLCGVPAKPKRSNR